MASLLLTLVLAKSFALSAATRSHTDYPLQGWSFGSPVVQKAAAETITPRYRNEKLVSLELLEYSGSDYAEFEAALKLTVERFRSEFGGATFGVDAHTLAPVSYDGKMEATVLHMLRQAPTLAEDIRAKGGIMTAVFEIRPAEQPANANLYLHGIYDAKTSRYQLRMLMDAPEQDMREDITGLHVDMPGDPKGN